MCVGVSGLDRGRKCSRESGPRRHGVGTYAFSSSNPLCQLVGTRRWSFVAADWGSPPHCPEGCPHPRCVGAETESDVFLKFDRRDGVDAPRRSEPLLRGGSERLICSGHTGDRSGLSCCRVCSDDDAGPTSAPTGPSTSARARTRSRPCTRRPMARQCATVRAVTSAATQAAEPVALDKGIDH